MLWLRGDAGVSDGNKMRDGLKLRHARKTEIVLCPLFPGYVFVCLDIGEQRWRAVNGTFGVVRISVW